MRNPITPFTEYQGLPVITPRQREKTFLYYPNYLDMCRNLLDRAIVAHGLITLYRIDLTFPCEFTWQNPKQYYELFISSYRKALNEREHDPQYLVRMEQKGNNPHFHMAFVLKGSINTLNLKEFANELWMSLLQTDKQGLVDFCRYDHYTGARYPEQYVIHCPWYSMNNPSSLPKEYHSAFHMLSYLAKYQEEDITFSHERKIFSSLGCRK
ncbi:MAG TPA: hypothetical protein DFL85_05980 [Lentisphaeria bacterium]|jgi:hypothetical protein|nr:hypothetical protein [Lentisphaeria bacterium]HCH85044.1 hypothetical protein [Lentisphaeria bacterium]